VAMHQAHLQLHHPQAGRGFTRQKAAPNNRDSLFNAAHFAKRQGVPNGAQINHVSEPYACDGRTKWTASRSETRLVEFNALPVAEHGHAPIDIELRDYGIEPGLDLVRTKPALVEFRQLLHLRVFFPHEILRENPSLVGVKKLPADQRDGSALVVLPNAFTGAGSADPGTDDEIITLNHLGMGTIENPLAGWRGKFKSISLRFSLGRSAPYREALPSMAVASLSASSPLPPSMRAISSRRAFPDTSRS
jgi:hypothetical protein